MAEAVYEYWDDAIRDEVRQEVRAELLIEQLSHRFGPLPKWAKTRVSKAKTEQLKKWATAVFDAANLTEVLGQPAGRLGASSTS